MGDFYEDNCWVSDLNISEWGYHLQKWKILQGELWKWNIEFNCGSPEPEVPMEIGSWICSSGAQGIGLE